MYKVTALIIMISYILCGSCGSEGVHDIAMLKLFQDTNVNVPGPLFQLKLSERAKTLLFFCQVIQL